MFASDPPADNLAAQGSAKQRRSWVDFACSTDQPFETHDSGVPMTGPHVSSPYPIRDDLAAAQARAWARIARPGTWWDAETRVAIAAETRHAPACEFCRRRREALVPSAVEGSHDSLGRLPKIAVEVVHR